MIKKNRIHKNKIKNNNKINSIQESKDKEVKIEVVEMLRKIIYYKCHYS
jgi:hypothetical protein